MKRMGVLVLATLFLAGCGMAFAPPLSAADAASGPDSLVVAPAGATFFDDFSKGKLDTSKWIASNWGAPGGGKFVPSYLDFSSGMLRIKVTQTYTSTGAISSVGGELQSTKTLGFGTYEWVIRASSTSSTPTGSGVARARWRAHKGVHLSEVVKRMSRTITTTATTSIPAIVSLFDVVSFGGLTSGEYMLPDRIFGVY